MTDLELNDHRAQLFDAIRAFFVELEALTKVARSLAVSSAVQAVDKQDHRRRTGQPVPQQVPVPPFDNI
jgi:hypothetical protein